MKRFFLISLVVLCACKKTPTDCVNPDADPEQIFDCTYLVAIPEYTYIDSSGITPDTLHIFGDSKVDSFLPPINPDVPVPQPFYDTFSKNFVIQWQSPPAIQLQLAAVFKHPIQSGIVDGFKKILNPDDIVWLWYSGLGSNDGKVPYSEGQAAKLDAAGNIIPLPSFTFNPDSLYYLGIWGWDDGGEKIIYSSKQIRMRIK